MPDFINMPMQQCSSLDDRHATVGKYSLDYIGGSWDSWECTCKGFQYSKEPKSCKHIDYHLKTRCTWHELTGRGQADEERNKNICPECGRETVWVMVAV